MRRDLAAFGSGLVFAIGLALSGMTHPSKVLAFLDVTGAWDPSLALVMAGAVGVSAIAFRIAARRARPAFDARFVVPSARGPIGARVIVGAAIFGAGWGLSGLCPGPAVVSLASGQLGALVFAAAAVVGILAERAIARRAPALADARDACGGDVAPP